MWQSQFQGFPCRVRSSSLEHDFKAVAGSSSIKLSDRCKCLKQKYQLLQWLLFVTICLVKGNCLGKSTFQLWFDCLLFLTWVQKSKSFQVLTTLWRYEDGSLWGGSPPTAEASVRSDQRRSMVRWSLWGCGPGEVGPNQRALRTDRGSLMLACCSSASGSVEKEGLYSH